MTRRSWGFPATPRRRFSQKKSFGESIARNDPLAKLFHSANPLCDAYASGATLHCVVSMRSAPHTLHVWRACACMGCSC
jgi:hypothetical protein